MGRKKQSIIIEQRKKVNSKSKTKTVRKERFAFTIDKDISLLRNALLSNPWQHGNENWQKICDRMKKKFNCELTVRSVKTRIDTLLKKFRSEQLQTSTGTEEQKTERGKLLELIDGIINEETSAINKRTSADDGETSGDDASTEESEYELSDDGMSEDEIISLHSDDEVNTAVKNKSSKVVAIPSHDERSKTVCEAIGGQSDNVRVQMAVRTKELKKKRLQEKKSADEERDVLLNEASEPSKSKKKARLSLEDELVVKRHEHDMKMEVERMELEKRREVRLEDEGRRRDEINLSQVFVQQSMLFLFTKIFEKEKN